MIDLPETLFEDESDPDLVEGLRSYEDKDWNAALAPLEIAARRGNVTAIFKLANSLANLDREDEAIPLWLAAVNFGHVGACNNYAIRLNRKGDTEGARALYLRAAQSGEPQAIFNYAMTLDEEDQTAEFREWLRKSANAGMLRAQAMLGKHLHEHGEQEEGLELLEDAMEKGSLSAHLLAANIANTNEQHSRAFDLADKGLALPLSDDDKHLVRNVYLIRGIAADHLGMREQAISDVVTSKEMGFDVSIAPRHLREPERYSRSVVLGNSQAAKHHAATRQSKTPATNAPANDDGVKTNLETRLDILGWMYELYNSDDDYKYFDVIDSHRDDFEAVYDMWVAGEHTNETLTNTLFDKVLSDLGLNDYGDSEWFYNVWKLRD